MGLFGGLFNKEPQEVKEFWKAFGNLSSKLNQKNFDAMAEAARVCPDIWQGPFLMGLAMELPEPAVPYDEEKVNSYHYQAQQLAKNTADAAWVKSFYSWYRSPALNGYKAHTRESMAVRRLGVAAMNTYENMKPVVSRHDNNDDAKFWSKLFWAIRSLEAEPFRDLFGDWKSYNGGKASHDTMEMYTRDLVKNSGKCIERCNKINQKLKKGKEVSDHELDSIRDMYPYIVGRSLLASSPYILEEWEQGTPEGGVYQLINAARCSNGAAVHYLAYLLFSDDQEVREITRRGFAASDADETSLKGWLTSAAQCGDTEAQEMLDKHFPG